MGVRGEVEMGGEDDGGDETGEDAILDGQISEVLKKIKLPKAVKNKIKKHGMMLGKDLKSLQATKRRVEAVTKDIAELQRNRVPNGMKPFKVSMEVPELDERYIVVARPITVTRGGT